MKNTVRHLACALLAALALLAGTALAQEAVTPIRDAAGLRAIALNPFGSYRLAADIDMGGEDWTPLAFFGKLDGAGHTLYNLRVSSVGPDTRITRDGNMKEYDTAFAALFSVLESAEVSNLTLAGARVEAEGNAHCFAAILAGYMDRSRISGCRVEGKVRLNNYAVMSGVGGLAGFGCGEMENCEARVELVFEDRNFDQKCEQFMGGALACGIARITGCTVEIDGYDSCHGYVHNGGLVGMYYHCGTDYSKKPVSDNSISGRIRFFEDNRDRRAYCKAVIGESLSKPSETSNNREDFLRDEVKDYTRVLLPEECESPKYTEELTLPTCAAWGYTAHACATCGYAWIDGYLPPRHVPGAWETVRETGYDEAGVSVQKCAVCGMLLGERAIPLLARVQSCDIEPGQMDMHPGQSGQLSVRVLPEDAADRAVLWSSSDPSVVTVDENGWVEAVGQGSAEILCRSRDGYAQGTCQVAVSLTPGQWFEEYILFGWLRH